jgi:thiol-disulfide isomerase/thioredoxin
LISGETKCDAGIVYSGMKTVLSFVALGVLLALMPGGSAFAQVEKMYYKEIAKELHKPGDKIKVVNLWATWCKPCVAELPYFDAYAQAHADEIEMVLVSLDFPADQDSRLPAFLEKKGIKSRVIAVRDTDPNDWIPLVNPGWQGAIPATYIVDKKGKIVAFHSASLQEKELDELVKKHLN